MSDTPPKPPREFWLDCTGLLDDWKGYEFEGHVSKPDGWDDCKLEHSFHVIEYSAFQALEEKLREAQEENEELMNVEYWSDRCKLAEKERDELKAKLEGRF